MPDLHLKRLTDNRNSVFWAVYKTGSFETPIVILHEFEIVQLVQEFKEQQPEKVKV